ncbi:MAG: hypothetical protein IJT59_06245 [Desulfovibrionaceae bacterium]|nr:hypothetical protein [Desulfovibrionaceae bacterium]
MSEHSTHKNILDSKDDIQNENFPNSSGYFSLTKGQVILDTLDNKRYRLLYIPNQFSFSDKSNTNNPNNKNNINNSDNKCMEKGYLICIDTESNIPEEFYFNDIQLKLQAGRYVIVQDNLTPNIPDKISKLSLDRMEKSYALIENLINIEPDIYDKHKRSELFKKYIEENNIPIKKLYIYIGKYWRCGMVKEALLPNYSKIGTYRKENFVAKQRLGRPSKRSGRNGKILTETDYQNFNEYIKQLYLATKKPKLTEVYENMLAHCYTIPRFDGDTNPTPLPPEEKPSYMQFYYWYQKNRDRVESDIAEATKAQGSDTDDNVSKVKSAESLRKSTTDNVVFANIEKCLREAGLLTD